MHHRGRTAVRDQRERMTTLSRNRVSVRLGEGKAKFSLSQRVTANSEMPPEVGFDDIRSTRNQRLTDPFDDS